MTGRRAIACAALIAALFAPVDAAAQSHPEALLEDSADFRGALRGPAANVTVRSDGDVLHGRVRCGPDGWTWLSGRPGAWTASDEVLPFELRLLGALYATSGVTETVAALGFRLDATLLGVDAMDTPEGTVFVAHIGGSHVEVVIEHDIARTREIRVLWAGEWHVVRALEYGPAGNGWFPTRAEVRRGDVTVLSVEVTDVGPSASNLAALDAGAAPVRSALRLPRLPL